MDSQYALLPSEEKALFSKIEGVRSDQAGLIEQIIFALSGAVEAKDRYTNGHSRRVADYSREIMRRLGGDEDEQRSIFYAGMLHDIGKIRVPDTIINKPGRLTGSEYNEMKLHTLAGYYILKEVSGIAKYAIGARWHHERYDGKGYPNGLSGENIPLFARVIAVADAYDAMTSNRSYREIAAQAYVRQEMAKGSGTQFDPVLAGIMLEMIDEDTSYDMRQHSLPPACTILAIDDDPMVLRLLEFTMKDNPHYRLLTANSGRRGMDVMERESVDLVLLDVEMPEINGFETLAWIRQRWSSLPVTFMTGDKDMEIIQRAEAMGISDYLTKPLVAHILWESIQNVLSLSRYSRDRDPFFKGGDCCEESSAKSGV